MPYTTNPYATSAQVYSALDLSPSSQTTDGAWITELIGEAQAAIDRYLGFSFQTDGTVQSPATRLYSGNGGDTLFIPERLISFSQVLETTYNVVQGSNGAFISQTTSTVDITADCVAMPDNSNPLLYLQRLTGLPFQQGRLNYKVFGVFGRPSIPYDITRACIRIVVHWYKMRDTAYSDLVAEQGAIRQKYSKQMPADVLEILDDYKPRRFRC